MLEQPVVLILMDSFTIRLLTVDFIAYVRKMGNYILSLLSTFHIVPNTIEELLIVI